MCPSDVFTFHMAAMQMVGVCGCGFYCWGVFGGVPRMTMLGVQLFSVTSNGDVFLHMITCVELHLAVVHPITYLRLRNRGGVRIRTVSVGFVWLIFFGLFGLTSEVSNFNLVLAVSSLVVSAGVVSFCSLSAACTLVQPGPGEGGRSREKVDRSKRRAFHTILAIMGVLLFRFGGQLLVLVIYFCSALRESVRCGVLVSGVWFCLPSSVMLPLLFLHRTNKRFCLTPGSQ